MIEAIESAAAELRGQGPENAAPGVNGEIAP
jgi:hypothetical protein